METMTDTKPITIKVLFFASAREAAGNINETELIINDYESMNTSGIRKILATMYPNLALLVLDEESVTLALNEEYVPSGAVLQLKNDDTIALIPPISGG